MRAGGLTLSHHKANSRIDSRRQLAARRKNIDPAWVEERIAARVAARKAKDFSQADRIRDEVNGRGVELRDSPGGTEWRVLL